MSRVKFLYFLLLSGTVCGCTILDPYIDRRRNPGTGDVSKLYSGFSKADEPAVCYNPLLSEDNELQALADAECVKNNTGTHAVFKKTSSFSCKIFLPSVNFYKCVK